MGLFDRFGNREQKLQMQAEDREREHVNKRDVFAAGMQDDSAYAATMEYRNDLIRWQQDLDDELLELVQILLGLQKIAKDKWVRISEPLCNSKFVQHVIIPHCKPFTSRNLINSNLDERMILSMLKNTCNDIADSISDGFDIYDIDFRNYDNIMREIKNTIIPGPFRALKGWTKRMDSTMIKRIESFNEKQPKQQKKVLGVFT